MWYTYLLVPVIMNVLRNVVFLMQIHYRKSMRLAQRIMAQVASKKGQACSAPQLTDTMSESSDSSFKHRRVKDKRAATEFIQVRENCLL